MGGAYGDFLVTRMDLTRAVKERLAAVGVSTPFPQRDAHLHRVAAQGD